MKIHAVGEQSKSTGFAVAFDRHVKALRECADVETWGFGQIIPADADLGYLHGPSDKVANEVKFGYNIGYLVCESSLLQQTYFKAAARLDEVWTCSSYCADALQSLKRPVKVIPHYAEGFGVKHSNNENPVFLVAFNADSRVVRKNPVRAIEAIRLACPEAEVVVKCFNLSPSIEGWIRKAAGKLKLSFVKKVLTKEELDALYEKCDILVSLHSSEGFGLHLLEAMAMGKCVVGSAWGGNLDFMHNRNSFLVECEEVDADDDYFLGTWGYPKLKSSVDAVSAALEKWNDREFAEHVVNSVKMFSFERVAERTKLALNG